MADSVQTERAVVGIVLMQPETAIAAALAYGVKAAWFADDTCHVAWLAVEQLWADGKGGEADALVIFNAWKKIAASPETKKKNLSPRVDFGAVDALIDAAPPLAHLEHHCGQLRDCFMERQVREACQRAATNFRRMDATAAAVGLRSDIDAILSGTSATSGRRVNLAATFAELMGEYQTAYQKRIVEKNLTWSPGYKFPWPEMTAVMNGLEPGLGVIAARPSVGKTLFALNLIRYWCDTGINVVFNSLDMEQHSLVRRFIAERGRVSIKKARFSPTRADLDAMQKACDEMANWPLNMVEIRDVEEFCSYCMVEHSAGRCQIAVVDYLGLMASTKVDNANEYARVSYVSDKLKSLANRLRIPVIALCQLNRNVTKDGRSKEPTLADLRGSGSVEQDAFWVIVLHRDEDTVNGRWLAPTSSIQPDNRPWKLLPPGSSEKSLSCLDSVFAQIIKAQNGELGKFPFVFYKHYLAAFLGDMDARPVSTETGHGATAATKILYYPMFERIHADWRHDPLEAAIRPQGALIEMRDEVEGE